MYVYVTLFYDFTAYEWKYLTDKVDFDGETKNKPSILPETNNR